MIQENCSKLFSWFLLSFTFVSNDNMFSYLYINKGCKNVKVNIFTIWSFWAHREHLRENKKQRNKKNKTKQHKRNNILRQQKKEYTDFSEKVCKTKAVWYHRGRTLRREISEKHQERSEFPQLFFFFLKEIHFISAAKTIIADMKDANLSL